MKTNRILTLASVLLTVALTAASAQNPAPVAPGSLDAILKQVSTYDGGISSDALWKLRDYVYARKDEAAGRAECETKLLAFLKGPATHPAKMAATRLLRMIAGDTSHSRAPGDAGGPAALGLRNLRAPADARRRRGGGARAVAEGRTRRSESGDRRGPGPAARHERAAHARADAARPGARDNRRRRHRPYRRASGVEGAGVCLRGSGGRIQAVAGRIAARSRRRPPRGEGHRGGGIPVRHPRGRPHVAGPDAHRGIHREHLGGWPARRGTAARRCSAATMPTRGRRPSPESATSFRPRASGRCATCSRVCPTRTRFRCSPPCPATRPLASGRRRLRRRRAVRMTCAWPPCARSSRWGTPRRWRFLRTRRAVRRKVPFRTRRAMPLAR